METKKPTVFVANYSGYNYTAAEEFGSLQFITRNHVDLNDVPNIIQSVMKKVAGSTPDDFLLLSGSSLISIIAFQILSDMHGRVNLLYFDKKANKSRNHTIHTTK